MADNSRLKYHSKIEDMKKKNGKLCVRPSFTFMARYRDLTVENIQLLYMVSPEDNEASESTKGVKIHSLPHQMLF